MTLAEIAADEKAYRALVNAIMDNGAREALRDVIGDRSPRAYDRADEIARGVARGIRNTLDGVVEGARA